MQFQSGCRQILPGCSNDRNHLSSQVEAKTSQFFLGNLLANFYQTGIAVSAFAAIALAAMPAATAFNLKPPVTRSSFADIIVVADESGSMEGEHAWIANLIPQLDTALIAAGVGAGTEKNRYGLVGFGGFGCFGWLEDSCSEFQRKEYQFGSSQFGSASDFAAATKNLTTWGSTEDGYAGADAALNYRFRPGAAVNVILITDEDRDISDRQLNFSSLLSAFTEKNALLNAVINASFSNGSGGRSLGIDFAGNAYSADDRGGYTSSAGGRNTSSFGTTNADYVDLALATGGAAWDINLLRQGGSTATAFSKAFIDVKVKEIQAQKSAIPLGESVESLAEPAECVPEPSTILGSVALSGLFFHWRLKRRQKQ